MPAHSNQLEASLGGNAVDILAIGVKHSCNLRQTVGAVSYTHLDVYKRQVLPQVVSRKKQMVPALISAVKQALEEAERQEDSAS